MPPSAWSRHRTLILTLLLPLAGAPGHPSGILFAQSGTQPAAAPGTAAPPAPAAGVDFFKERDAIFDAFYTTGLETSAPYTVTNLAIKKDNMTLLLKQG